MSLLTFLGLRQPRSNRVQLTLVDVLHRTLVSGLAGLTVYGVYLGYSVHQHTMQKGREFMALRETEAKARDEAQAVEEAREQSLAAAAQGALHKRS
ncbi:hypothetical protein PAXINDRAFT_114719 [Paxillus involutus ATCC 200175]|uniref:Uncharacterized protein n=1 Tax=Paxillus involutus ATCC 200175 TaxID=664439 RepID=A0A0C9TIK9_PAXIN|nr:hypothetical protein PAXINDRAFT_114719 [Paxillus involutus ATCC 200175]